ncbi:hypothetical protein BJF78_27955 [Pseudonocardia sp. CNS-139]|nr:hypothetical protein BJF78_27955 [Pseudonocardia sp. CNS-139]
MRVELIEGLRWFWSHHVVRSLTMIAVAVNLAAGGFYAVLVLLVRDELGAGAIGFGVLLAVGALGSVIAGTVAGRLTSGVQRRAAVQLVAPVAAVCFGVVAAARDVVTVGVAMIVFSFVVTVANVVMVSLRQLLAPGEMLGRVMAVHRFFCWGSLPIGAVLAGFVGEFWGVREAIAVCGISALVLGLATGFPLLRLRSGDFDPSLPSPA